MSTAGKSITFIVTEDASDGGYVARAHWPAGNRDLITQAGDRAELLQNVRESIDAAFDNDDEKPALIHLQYVRDEVIAR